MDITFRVRHPKQTISEFKDDKSIYWFHAFVKAWKAVIEDIYYCTIMKGVKNE